METIEETLAQMEEGEDGRPEVVKDVVISGNVVEPRGQIEVVTVSETATQITILDAAIQECGIGDDGIGDDEHEHFDDVTAYDDEQNYQGTVGDEYLTHWYTERFEYWTSIGSFLE